MNNTLEELVCIAKKLGFEVIFSRNLSFNHSKASFYPIRKIVIGIRNYNNNTSNYCGKGCISEHAQALILEHEIAHIIIYKTLYPDMPIEEFCLNDNTEWKIRQEIYAWKVVVAGKKLSLQDLAFIQETINQYVYCEIIGTCTIEAEAIAQQEILNTL